MIVGIGLDIVDVADIARRLERAGFGERVFSPRERAHAEAGGVARNARRTQRLAGCWAVKEAFAKALGSGLRAEWPLEQIEVVHEAGGRPRLVLGPDVAALLPPAAVVHCSISHTASTAVGIAVIEAP